MTSIRKISLAAALVAGIGFTADSFAGTSTSNMSLSAAVSDNCTLTAAAPPAFPYDAYVANATINYTTNFLITYTCTSGATPTIVLDQGLHAFGGSTAVAPNRQMANGTNRLLHNIFSTAGNLGTGSVGVAWGTNLAMSPTLALGTGAAQTVPAYILILAGQLVPAGTYTDTVVMTVNF